MPRLVVIVATSAATYERASYLACHETLLRQRQHFDLCVVLNGPDPAAESWATALHPQHLLVRPNLGFDSAAFHEALHRLPAYDWYFFMHDDHWFCRPDWWSYLHPLLEGEPCAYGNLYLAEALWPLGQTRAIHSLHPPYGFAQVNVMTPFTCEAPLETEPLFAEYARLARPEAPAVEPDYFKFIGGLAGLFPGAALEHLIRTVGGVPHENSAEKSGVMEAEAAFSLLLHQSPFPVRQLPLGCELLLSHHCHLAVNPNMHLLYQKLTPGQQAYMQRIRRRLQVRG